MVAILVLQSSGGIVVEPDPRLMSARRSVRRARRWSAVVVIALDQVTKALVRASDRARRPRRRRCRASSSSTSEHGVAFGRFSAAAARSSRSSSAPRWSALLVYFARHLDRPLIWLPTGLLLGGALGNIIDRSATAR